MTPGNVAAPRHIFPVHLSTHTLVRKARYSIIHGASVVLLDFAKLVTHVVVNEESGRFEVVHLAIKLLLVREGERTSDSVGSAASEFTLIPDFAKIACGV